MLYSCSRDHAELPSGLMGVTISGAFFILAVALTPRKIVELGEDLANALVGIIDLGSFLTARHTDLLNGVTKFYFTNPRGDL